MFVLFFSVIRAQNTYTLYVGDRQLLVAPNPPTGAIYQTAWGASGVHLKLEKYMTTGAYVTVTGYFEGTEQVQCDYYWRWYDASGRMYTNHSTAYYLVKCKSVTVTPSTSNMTLAIGEGQQLSYSISPSNVSPKPTVQFISQNTNVVQVNSNGYVKAVGPGSTYITLTNSMGPTASCYVTVKNSQPTGVSLPSNATVYIEESVTLTPTVTPSGVSTTFSWWSDDTKVATVSSSGKVTGVSIGSTKIWVKTDNGGFTDYCNVSVIEPNLTLSSCSPSENALNVACNTKPSATFSANLYKGTQFNSIRLQKTMVGSNVSGTVSISGKTVIFIPSEDLESNCKYTFVIPANALQNKWGTPYTQQVSIDFMTTVNPKDIKFLTVWAKNGTLTSIPLDDYPKLNFNTDTGVILCKSRTKDITFLLNDVYKYTLETNNSPTTSVSDIQANKAKLFAQPNAIIVEGCTPHSDIIVSSVNGNVVKHSRANDSGNVTVPTDILHKGIYIIKVGSMSYKITVK